MKSTEHEVHVVEERMKSMSPKRSHSPMHHSSLEPELEKENETLRNDLEEAHQDLGMLRSERDKLMEISNMLKSNVSKLMSSNMKESVSDAPLSILDLEGDVTRAYEDKIRQIERILRDLLRQNKFLKSELSRIMSSSTKRQSGSAAAIRHMHPGATAFCEDPLCQFRYMYSVGFEHIQRGIAQANLRSSIDKLGRDIESSITMAAQMPRLSELPNTSSVSQRGTTAPPDAPEPERDEDQNSAVEPGDLLDPQFGDGSRRSFNRIRRLNQVKTEMAVPHVNENQVREVRRHLAHSRDQHDAISLHGSTSALSEGYPRRMAARASERATSSQGEAEMRLREQQRKRTELISKRKAIRNYNDLSRGAT